MHPFHSLFTEDAETEYVPDNFGRIGQGGFVVKPDPEPIGTPSPRFDAFNKAEQSGMDLSDLFGANPLAIKGPVGPTGPNRRADVGKIETFMSRSGNHDLSPTDGPTGYYGLRLEDSINAFQKAKGLKPDGLLNPRGKTIKALAGKLKDQIKPPTQPAPQPIPTAPLTLPGRGAGQENAPLKHPGGGLGGTHPEIAAAAPPAKDPLEAFKKADRESMRPIRIQEAKEIDRKMRTFILEARAANLGSKAIRAVGAGDFLPNVNIGNTIDAMQRYVDGIGGVKNYNPKWILSNKTMRETSRRIDGHYVDWIVGKGKKTEDSRRIIENLQALKPNQQITETTDFDGFYKLSGESDHSLLLGKGFIRAIGKFTFTRKGNIIEVTGTAVHRVNDPFDWTPGLVNKFEKYGIKREIRHDDMIKLQRYGKAKPFIVRSVWRRAFVGRIRIEPIPGTNRVRILGVESSRWTDIE